MEATGARNARLGDPFTGSANWGVVVCGGDLGVGQKQVTSKRVALRNGTKD